MDTQYSRTRRLGSVAVACNEIVRDVVERGYDDLAINSPAYRPSPKHYFMPGHLELLKDGSVINHSAYTFKELAS